MPCSILFNSRDLRKALDVSSKELPQYIYHMRQLGYPPGWMQEALLQDSGISIFDKDGNGKLLFVFFKMCHLLVIHGFVEIAGLQPALYFL
jgi:hypothetical protein